MLALLACAVAACAAVLDIDELPLRPDAALDGGDGSTSELDPCGHALPPPPPEQPDVGDSVPAFYLAVRTMSFLDDGSAVAGFDLDGVCTCEPRPNTAFDGGSSFFGSFADVLDIDQVSGFAAQAAAGERTMLLHVSDYNGTPNDSDVRLGIMPSRGIVDGSGCGTVPVAGSAPPGWCGRDRWTYPLANVLPSTKVPLERVKGWVKDGKLAFRSDASISILVGKSVVKLSAPMGAGKLFKAGDGNWRLEDAVLAGRAPMTDILAAVGTFDEPRDGGTATDGGPRKLICQGPLFPALKGTICDQSDITDTPASDFRAAACNAMSTAVRLVAEQSDIGDEYTPPPFDNPCAIDRADAGLYDCPKAGP
jgi:hypothetical protein